MIEETPPPCWEKLINKPRKQLVLPQCLSIFGSILCSFYIFQVNMARRNSIQIRMDIQWTFALTNLQQAKRKYLPGVLERTRWQLRNQSLIHLLSDMLSKSEIEWGNLLCCSSAWQQPKVYKRKVRCLELNQTDLIFKTRQISLDMSDKLSINWTQPVSSAL